MPQRDLKDWTRDLHPLRPGRRMGPTAGDVSGEGAAADPRPHATAAGADAAADEDAMSENPAAPEQCPCSRCVVRRYDERARERAAAMQREHDRIHGVEPVATSVQFRSPRPTPPAIRHERERVPPALVALLAVTLAWVAFAAWLALRALLSGGR